MPKKNKNSWHCATQIKQCLMWASEEIPYFPEEWAAFDFCSSRFPLIDCWRATDARSAFSGYDSRLSGPVPRASLIPSGAAAPAVADRLRHSTCRLSHPNTPLPRDRLPNGTPSCTD